jgi:hypothetical protein
MSTAKSDSARPRLTVAVLANGRPECLERSLQSVRGVADELLVIDGGQDGQVATIADQHGARRIEHRWQESYGLARNAGMAAAEGDWVFWLEEYEHLSIEQAQSLRYLVDQQRDFGPAWMVYVQTAGGAAHDAPQRKAQLRLLPNRAGVRFEGRVAETARPSLASMGITIELSSLTVVRDALHDDPAVKQARARRDLKLLDKDLPERGPQPALLCLLGDSHQALGNPIAAGKYFQQAARTAQPGSPELLEAYYGLLTTIDDAHHETRQALCLEALEIYPFDAQLLCAMGSYLESQHRHEMACRAYQTAVQFGQVHPETWHLTEIGEIAAHCLATLWQLQENDDNARQVLQESLTRLPHSARLRRSLIDLEVRYGRVIDALGQLEKLPGDFPHREAFRSAVRGACQAARKNWVPAIAYLQTAYDAGCRDAICLRWLWIALMTVDRRQEAGNILLEWQQLEPENLEVRKYLADAEAATAASGHAAVEGRQVRIDRAQPALDCKDRPAARSGLPAYTSKSRQ